MKSSLNPQSNTLHIKKCDNFTLQSSEPKIDPALSNSKKDISSIISSRNIKKSTRPAQKIDKQQVAKYRSLIKKGLYKVDPEKLAQKLINIHAKNGNSII